MTYVETSVIVAILLEEPDAQEQLARLHAAERPVISAVNAVEAALSIGKSIKDYPLGGRLVAEFLKEAGITVLAITPDCYDDVITAYSRYGKGTGHSAKLNFGDCFSYAFAKRLNIPLLFKGNDFSQTDLAMG